MKSTYLQYLQTDGFPFPRSKRRLISRALLLFMTGLVIGATCVVASPGMFGGAGGVSSSSDISETLSRSISSSSTGAGWTTGGQTTGAGRTGAGRALD